MIRIFPLGLLITGPLFPLLKSRKEFLDKGWTTSRQFDRVYAPVGLPIQSKTVEEIAVSIAAQLVLVRSQLSHKQR